MITVPYGSSATGSGGRRLIIDFDEQATQLEVAGAACAITAAPGTITEGSQSARTAIG